ncbi:MAG: amidohydrolase [Hyphomicrobiales bacterium]|nr:amidohydrolase [Hyphomicrobiales bacterium]
MGRERRFPVRWLLTASLIAMSAAQAQAQQSGPDQPKQTAFEAIDRNAKQIAEIGDAVYFFAEPGMHEFESTKLLKGVLEGAGFSVELGGAGMPTNLWAKWGSGKPNILIASEIDALPEGSQTPGSIPRKPMVPGAPGHMEGHNTHAGVTAATVFAVKQAMEKHKLPGTIQLSLGPAEEALGSRPFLVRAGYLNDVDAVLIVHIGDNFATGYGPQNYAAISATFTFHGKTAHAAVSPWEGRDAVDAVQLMDMGLDKMREHMRPTARTHRSIMNGGVQPNIIADLGRIWWFVRDASAQAAKENFDRLVKVGEGAALMTGTKMDPPDVVASAWPSLGNRPISEAIRKNMESVGLPKWSDEEVAFAKEFQKANGFREVGLATSLPPAGPRPQSASSNDIGDFTWNVPAGLMQFPGYAPGTVIHAWPAAVTPTSSMAHKGMVAAAKVMSASAIDLLTSPELLQKARDQFAQDTKDTKYFSLLPADAKPQLELNKEVMDKLRPAMSKFYMQVSPRFE